MIVPQYWAEARLQRPRSAGQGQVTVRRFGWSDLDPAEAQRMAEARAREAMDRVLGGEKLARREPKVPYNGAEGVPIREEVLARHGDVVITRNAYGAQCLNTPDVLFADIDFDQTVGCRAVVAMVVALVVAAGVAGAVLDSVKTAVVGSFLALVLAYPLARALQALATRVRGGPERRARSMIETLARRQPGARLRLYRTPRGFRVLAVHRTFDPNGAEVAAWFDQLGVDPVYARMSRNQHCFRARLTAKPWRAGLPRHMPPRPGTWPVRPERLPERRSWVLNYEAHAANFAACAFIAELGDGPVDAKAAAVRDLHDRLSQALSGRALA